MYSLEVEVIPPHTPCIRVDHEDAVFLDASSQMAAMLSSIQEAHEKGQPVLIGTRSVAESEMLSLQLAQHGLPHRVLNARNDEEEAAVIAEAGRARQITISTNMAGRGVDIRLGGSVTSDAGMVRNACGARKGNRRWWAEKTRWKNTGDSSCLRLTRFKKTFVRTWWTTCQMETMGTP